MPANSKIKTALIYSHFGPYHMARFRSLRKLASKYNIEVTGVELFRHQTRYPWDRDASDLPIVTVKSENRSWQARYAVIPKCLTTIKEITPDILIIAGYGEAWGISLIIWAILTRTRFILLSESKHDDRKRLFLVEKIKKWLLKNASACLVGGLSHKRYLESLGVNADAIWMGYDVVENDIFSVAHRNASRDPNIRPFFLTVSQLVPKKNLSTLIHSYADYKKMAKDSAWDLVICGEGPLRHTLTADINHFGLQNHVHLKGFLQLFELLPLYTSASCFIHASSQEQWGLVVNEAMASGLPVLVSRTCGCYPELVREGINGFGFDPTDRSELADLMFQMSSGRLELMEMGEQSLNIIKGFTPEISAENLLRAINYSLSRG